MLFPFLPNRVNFRFEPTASFVTMAVRKTYSLLQNAVSSYWPGLTLGANLQLTHQCFNPQEHVSRLTCISGLGESGEPEIEEM